MDISKRLTQARPFLTILSSFDDAGMDIYDSLAALFFDTLNQSEENWNFTLGFAARRLLDLAEQTEGRWIAPEKGLKVNAEIASLAAIYNK